MNTNMKNHVKTISYARTAEERYQNGTSTDMKDYVNTAGE
jgi:hypothetical protein